MEIVAGINPRMQMRDVGDYARRVESLGFDTLHIPEMVHDPFVMSSLALAATSSLHVRTGVALAFVRSPMVSALSAWDLAQLSEGRFDLGLGTQIRKNVEERYGMPFDKPVNRLREYIGAVRACFDSFGKRECVPFQGEFYNLSRLQDEFIPKSLGDIRVPEIWLGAVGPKLSALAGWRFVSKLPSGCIGGGPYRPKRRLSSHLIVITAISVVQVPRRCVLRAFEL